jgi:hypothetical protein
MEAEYKAGKEVQIQLTKAVALENNRVVSLLPKKPAKQPKPRDQDLEILSQTQMSYYNQTRRY